MRKKKKCENCMYWKREFNINGICRRFPPFIKGYINNWSNTKKDGWCGEYQPKKTTLKQPNYGNGKNK